MLRNTARVQACTSLMQAYVGLCKAYVGLRQAVRWPSLRRAGDDDRDAQSIGGPSSDAGAPTHRHHQHHHHHHIVYHPNVIDAMAARRRCVTCHWISSDAIQCRPFTATIVLVYATRLLVGPIQSPAALNNTDIIL